MTIEETRKLGIEFERRIQEIIPEKEFIDKLDSETIYSFLNQYQDKYIINMYKNLDNITSDTNISKNVEQILQPLLSSVTLAQDDIIPKATLETGRSITYKLPNNFGMYIRSNSKVNSVYRYKNNPQSNSIQIVPNIQLSQNDVQRIIETPYDSFRILRNPIIIFASNVKDTNWKFGETFPIVFNREISSNADEVDYFDSVTILYDVFTSINQVVLVYYRKPKHFDVISATECELPSICFDDLVSGAVDLYLRHIVSQNNKQDKQKNIDNESD